VELVSERGHAAVRVQPTHGHQAAFPVESRRVSCIRREKWNFVRALSAAEKGLWQQILKFKGR
jgi:hypothetical protein